LFSQRGNCSVHFYEKGQSRRGPSLKIALDHIYSGRFASLFTLYTTELARHDDFEQDDLRRECDLYIPAPESSRKEAFSWHITTRNFFALVLERPVVGAVLGQVLIDLRERLDVFRPNDPRNHEDFMAYLEKLGYLEFAHHPDYALALLNFAEHFQLQELWIDAFSHSVGMNDLLRNYPEFHYVSRVTHALIMRAYLEMDLHLGRVTRTLSNFLEDDFSPSHFGVSLGARIHLDRFRSFLNEYYVAKFGYWPPPKRANFSKSLYKSMYFDFRSLYDYLVDLDSTSALSEQKPASGGICVLQNVKAFDERHKMMPLPHPHPLLPEEGALLQRTTGSQTSLMRSLMSGTKMDPATEIAMIRESLSSATNSVDPSITSSSLVKAYKRFEGESARRSDEKVSVTDGRKVRWLVVYATLQMLISVTRAPKEVRMTETTYPLCCLVTGTPPWQAGNKALKGVHTPSVPLEPATAKYLDVFSASIHPDCEMDDYISQRRTSTLSSSSASSRRTSMLTSRMETPPSTPPSKVGIIRNASMRSVKSFSSSIGSLSRRASLRRSGISITSYPLKVATPVPPPKTVASVPVAKSSNFTEIVVHGYGNGLSDSVFVEPSRYIPIEMSTESLPEIVISSQSPPKSMRWVDTRSMSVPDIRPHSAREDRRFPPLSSTHGADNCMAQTTIPESMRTPLLNGSDHGLPGLELQSGSHASSIDDSPPGLSSSSSRSNSPNIPDLSAGTVHETANEIISHDMSSPVSPTYSESTLSIQTPISPINSLPIILPVISTKKSMDLPMVVDIEEMSVYQPTGVPTTGTVEVVGGDEDDDEFPNREASKRWSVASKTRTIPVPLKSSLRTVANVATTVSKKRSVRIKEEPVEWVSRFRSVGPALTSR
jgi:hypothetical protein